MRATPQRLRALKYAELNTGQQDAATAALTRLPLRLDALAPGPGPQQHPHLIARHHALGALRLDEQLRELLEFGAADPPELPPSSRDGYQAETVRLLRERHGEHERIVLMLHHAHAQRVPMQLVPACRPCGPALLRCMRGVRPAEHRPVNRARA
ncbi:hypothetical protein [Streptomyces sclerotialus]|uniref:hypothetical protein n=1 Tax=Streptomyces sclerotialus TaxID=1957 RepID=UPI0004C7275F